MDKLLFFAVLAKDKFIGNLPNMDWGFYMMTGVSILCFFVYANFTYHAAIQRFWFGRRR
jgi:hypothetical protein